MIGLGLGLGRHVPRRQAATYLFDSLAAQPAAAIVFRKAASSATVWGRVRRSTDNAETDIGFSGAEVDTAAILAHCGSAAGYLVKIYDQTGNGRDWAMATASAQPVVCQSGALVTISGRLAMSSSTTTQRLEVVSTGLAGLMQACDGGTLCSSFVPSSLSDGTSLYINITSGTADRFSVGIVSGAATSNIRRVNSGSGASVTGPTLTISQPANILAVGRFTEGAQDLYVNGSSAGSGALIGSGPMVNAAPLYVRSPRLLLGVFGDQIIWNAALGATDRTMILADQLARLS